MSPPHLSFKHLKRTVTIQRVLAAEGLTAALNRRGNRLVGSCPLHGGDNPSAFVVDLDRDLWSCFTRCGTGGDVVELTRRLRHLDYREAADYLASLAQCHTPAQDSSTAPSPSSAIRSFHPYTRRLHLDTTAPFLRRKGIHPTTARRFEAGAYLGPGFCARSIAVRLHDPHGQPLGYAARHLDPMEIHQHGKWKLPPRLPKNSLLYGYHHCAKTLLSRGVVVVVECPWGVMRLAQLAVPAVALLGTHVSPDQRRLLAQAPTVVLMLDGDPAGRQASRRASELLARATNVLTVLLPDGYDPDDLNDAQLLASLRAIRR